MYLTKETVVSLMHLLRKYREDQGSRFYVGEQNRSSLFHLSKHGMRLTIYVNVVLVQGKEKSFFRGLR